MGSHRRRYTNTYQSNIWKHSMRHVPEEAARARVFQRARRAMPDAAPRTRQVYTLARYAEEMFALLIPERNRQRANTFIYRRYFQKPRRDECDKIDYHTDTKVMTPDAQIAQARPAPAGIAWHSIA